MQSTGFHKMKERIAQDKGQIILFVKGTGICEKAPAKLTVGETYLKFYYGKGQALRIEPEKIRDLRHDRIDFSLEIWKFNYGDLKIGLQMKN